MKIFATLSLAVAFASAPALASAQTQTSAVTATRSDAPDMRPRNCEPVGSGIEECVYDVECWEDEAQMMSICRKVTIYKPEAGEH